MMLLHYLGAQIRDNRSNLDLGDCEGSLSGKTAPNLNKKAVNKNGEKHSSQRVYSGQMQGGEEKHVVGTPTNWISHKSQLDYICWAPRESWQCVPFVQLAPHLFSGDTCSSLI